MIDVQGMLALALASAFGVAMGAHYTGACMGMAYAMGIVKARRALRLMAVLAFLGATFLSHGTLRTVAYRVVNADDISTGEASCVLASAFILTSLYNRLRIPTSTIQILIFSLAGVALARKAMVNWDTIGRLVALWVCAPVVSAGLGFALTRAFDKIVGRRRDGKTESEDKASTVARRMLLWAAMMASVAMGANDVANATGVLMGAYGWPPLVAGTLGGVALAMGIVGWGRGLLRRVAFEIARIDLAMAGAAQAVQAIVVLATVLGFGYFTSINQALVGAIGGAGLARGVKTVNWNTLGAIVVGWVVGPVSALALGYGLATAVGRLKMV